MSPPPPPPRPPRPSWTAAAAWLWRITASLVHPIVLVFFLAAVFSRLSGDTVRAAYFGAVGLALAWDRASRRGHAAALAGANGRAGAAGRDELVLARVAAFSADSAERRRAATRPLLGPALLAGITYAVVVGAFPRYSVPATVCVTSLAAAAIVVAWRTSGEASGPAPRLRPAGLAAWALVAVGASALELVSLYLQPTLTTDSYAHPTLSYLADGILAAWPGRSAVIFGWLAFGWYLARL